jgi:hypothetical protein
MIEIMNNTIKIGDTITYRGCFGSDLPKQAIVEHMEVTPQRRSKYGESVREVGVDMVKDNRVLFSMSDGHWCYSDQVDLKA